MPSSVSSSHGGQATLIDGRPPSPAMSTTTTLSPPSPVIGGGGGGKHDHHPSIISHDAMADVKSKIEKLANELKQQQQQCRQQSSNNTRPILPHLNTDSIITATTAKKINLTRPVLSPFSRAKSHQLQQHGHQPSTPGPVIPGLEPASRSLSDLHNERSYLLHNLQTQGERATRLYQRYAHLEAKKEALASTSSPSDENNATASSVGSKKKKIKKDLSLLRSRIAESTQQEQLIMLRLGEIHVELVNRGRWVMTHQYQHQHQHQMVYSPMSAVMEGHQGYFGHHQWHQQQNHGGGGGIPATPSSADTYSVSPVGGDEYLYTPSVLSPLSPSFVPGGGVSFFEDIWTRPSQNSQDHFTCPGETLVPAPGPEQEHEHHHPTEGQEEEEEEEEDDQTPKPKTSFQDLPLDSPAVPLSAVTPKFSTTTSTVSTVSTLPSEHLATPITPSRIPWDEYPSDSEDDGSFESFDASSFTPIGVTTINPLTCNNSLVNGSGSGSGSGSGVMISEPEENQDEEQEKEGEEDEEDEGSDESASEPGDLLSEQQRRTASFSRGGDDWTKGNNNNNNHRRLSMRSLKNLWPAALAAVGVQMGLEEEEDVPELRLDTVI
ncbi:hypothetical protein NEUTE1DRAFT_121259 [Neurospora tetrasperma FGSC 2508]|uniref:Uncharacterized protein n=1 Tax=Neurospora tetrasperma (strain FGSC 2508 / ATCC MYA-4615 / P0657) TaxID=510951 RepID=F8MGI7_NEUT8|nr:uncharacterized protein NEUTE1DRAFT_121259 [Neurospora tetrasperma FGSC 2508]EGO59459.1 hypothetical protein NEUTE1DRAFT_121259 [Neurospora tetrasperma FGSC 2508]EGZ73585.1 hypothetical protein NEUTE2DRAFT_108313 [Neurospora tetrasperma FGSC 2509]